MRPRADADRILAFAQELGRAGGRPTWLYLTGGATAVLEGWRETTIDIHIRLEPEPDELLRTISQLKESIGINVEFASPADLIPELPEWRERSRPVTRERHLEVLHFDYYSEALARLERAFDQDLKAVREMAARGRPPKP